LSYAPGTRSLVCPYCDSTIDISSLSAQDSHLGTAQASEANEWAHEDHGWADSSMAVYSCNSCGGEIVGDATLGSTSCPFCGNQVVISSKFSGSLKPDLVIPFNLTKQQAMDALSGHYKKKKLLPKVFKKANHIDDIKGVYVPFWLFSTSSEAAMEYEGKKVRSWTDGRYMYTETSTYQIIREGSIVFKNVPVDGSKQLDNTLMESIEPFDLSGAAKFETAYLAGFFANKYDVDSRAASPRAEERIVNSTSKIFRDSVSGFAGVTEQSRDINLTRGTVMYGLLPVWLLATSWKGKSFVFAMNGQTGKFVGDLPCDRGLFWKWFFGLFVGIGAAAVALFELLLYLYYRSL